MLVAALAVGVASTSRAQSRSAHPSHELPAGKQVVDQEAFVSIPGHGALRQRRRRAIRPLASEFGKELEAPLFDSILASGAGPLASEFGKDARSLLPSELKATDFSARELRVDAHSIGKLQDAGFSARSLVPEAAAVQAPDYGDLACMRWTGQTCVATPCPNASGPAGCASGRCLCAPGYCATPKGECVDTPGVWLGRYAIRFQNPSDGMDAPYLRVSGLPLGSTDAKAASATLPRWRLALTTPGFVRLQSDQLRDGVFTLYENRRRRTRHGRRPGHRLLEPRQVVPAGHLVGNSGPWTTRFFQDKDQDLWPMVRPLEDVSPLDATFMLRERSGGGVEIFDPQHGVSLATPDDGSFFFISSRLTKSAAKCAPGADFSAEACGGRQLVAFEPALPTKAVSQEGPITIREISGLCWRQLIERLLLSQLAFCALLSCVACVACRARPLK